MSRYADRMAAGNFTIGCELPKELHEAVKARAKAEDRSVSSLIRRAIIKYLEEDAQ